MTQDAVETLSAELQEAALKREAELQAVVKAGTNLPELIERLCPDGVEFVSLGELGEFVRGSGIQKSDLLLAGMPAIHYGQLHTVYSISAKHTVSFVNASVYEKAKKANPGDLVIVTTSEDTDAVAKAIAWSGSSPVAVSGDALIFRCSILNSYLAYLFQTQDFQIEKNRLVNGTKVRRISPAALSRLKVPVPPVEVQEEIVRILDLMTELEAELEAELEKRRLQYAHYRDSLLSFNSLTNFDRERERVSN